MIRQAGRTAVPGALLRPFHIVRWLLAVALCAALAACGGGGGGSSPPPAVAITGQPADVHVTAGASAGFTVVASGSVSYEWQRLQSTTSTWSDVAGGGGATLSLGAVGDADDGAKFRVIVASRSNPNNSITSSIVTLTVDPLVVPAAVVASPVDATVVENIDASFSVTASGTAPACQWQRSADGSLWADIAGATGTTLSLPTTLADDGARIRARVSNSLATVFSGTARLHVTATPEAPVFTTQPVAATVTAGQAATFTAVANGVPAPTLQWMTSTDGGTWTPIAGATGGSYTTPATTLADNGRWFRATASNASSTDSVAIQLTVNPVPAAPTIVLQPVDALVQSVQGVGVSATGTPAPTYQWQVSTDNGATFTNINGAVASTYAFVPQVVADVQLRVVVSNTVGSVTSRAATMTVVAVPQATSWPDSTTWQAGVKPLHFAVAATGGHLHYLWGTQRGLGGTFVSYPGAADATTFDLPATAPADTAQVCVMISNVVGSTSACTLLNSLRWTTLAPLPTPETLLAAAWTDANTVVAAGGVGTIVRSTDRGVTWAPVFIEGGSRQYARGLASHGNVVLAVGYNSFNARSTNGGLDWTEVYSAPNSGHTNVSFSAVAFNDAGVAIKVGGDTAAVVRTSSDLGLTWQDATVPASTDTLSALALNHANVVLAAGQNGLVGRSTDGGATWTFTHVGTRNLDALAFATDTVAVAAGDNGALWRSTDAGQTWTPVASVNTSTISDVQFASATVGVASAWGSAMLRTTNGGLTWSLASSDSSVAYDAVRFAPDGVTAVAVGVGGRIQRSLDAGATFADAAPSARTDYAGVAFNGAGTGLAAGGSGIVRTTDGATWTPMAGSGSGLASVAFASPTTAVAGGVNGVLMRSTNGGVSWSAVSSPNTSQVNAIAFGASGSGIAGAEDGILRTTDAGATWSWTNVTTSVNGGTQPGITSVAYADANTAVAVANTGRIYRSTDGGTTWSLIATPTAPWRGVAAASASVLVVVGDNGRIARSVDAGLHWTDITQFMMTETLTSLVFASATNGVAVGSHGAVLRTADAGQTWATDSAVVDTWLSGVAVNQGRAVAVGWYGAILRSDAL